MVNDDLLELRVHGVNNTPPTSLLYAIGEEYGDSLVGVYGQRSNTGLVRAFSWGGLARVSPIPRIRFAGWLQSVGSAAWFLVLPFGLANVAYWSRRLTMPGEKYRGARVTAGLARVFSLGLTLLLASSVCSVALDMADGRVRLEESPLPSWLRWLGNLEPGCRLAMLSAAPLLAMLLLFLLARRSRVRYDWGSQIPLSAPNLSAPGTAQADVWKFGSRDFWDNADLSTHNSAVHTAAGVALTSIWTGQIWFTQHHRAGVTVVVVSLTIVAVCVALIAYMPLVTEGKAIGKKRKALTWLVLSASFALFAAQFFALLFSYSPTQELRPLAGLSFVPGALVFMLLVLAVSALGWRWRRRLSYVVAAVPLVLGTAVLVVHQWKLVADHELAFVDRLLAVALIVLAAGWLVYLYHPGTRHSEDAWHGTAPGVLMILALFAAVLFSTVFVMAAAALLGDGNIRINNNELLTAPPIYLSFASMLTPAVIALLLLVIVVVGRTMLFCRNPIEPQLDRTTQPDAQELARRAEVFDDSPHVPWLGKLFRLRSRWNLAPTRCRKRRLAAAAHRAEPMAAVLAAVAGLAICSGLILSLMLHNGSLAQDAPIVDFSRKWGVWIAVLAGGFIAGLGTSRGRPLGIVWDLICFLPRAAHPFGPPCYAQRAVPELLNYCRAWLDTPGRGENPPPRKLILSAHSLGGVLAVAIVLLLAEKYRARIALVTYGCQLRAYFARIFPELLGPRILGVTTSRPARLLRCPTFDDGDSAVPDGGGYPASVRKTLTEANRVRWINLWRPTDYLGFPVDSRAPCNHIDWPADEVTAEVSADGKIVAPKPNPAEQSAAKEPADNQTPIQMSVDIHKMEVPAPMETPVRFESTTTVRVDTHSDYFRASQYPDAIKRLRERLGAAPSP
ncbi:hypothetical protein [Mycolicibacterium stellerae]|uniref:hypothetical protein n=1 Tax=Mycolicibacterium stellerae TaxID=2358193 RepID=UPI000F0BC959|nr:hypothetical protein [Mycolicibacterium stellerae]